MALNDRGLSFPLQLDPARGLRTTDYAASVRAMLEQILFTAPGERVNRPDFGVGVQNLVFEPLGPFLSNRVRLALEENAYNHLGRGVEIQYINVREEDALLHIDIRFQIARTPSSPQELTVSIPLEGVE